MAGPVRDGQRAMRLMAACACHARLAAAMRCSCRAAGAMLDAGCHGGHKPQQVAELMFGRKIGDAVGVSESALGAFRRPRDHAALPGRAHHRTAPPASGAIGPATRIIREPSKVVHDRAARQCRGHRAAQRDRRGLQGSFRQQSVGMIVRPACVRSRSGKRRGRAAVSRLAPAGRAS